MLTFACVASQAETFDWDARIEDGLAPSVADVRVLGGVGLWVVAADQVLALGRSGGRGVEQRVRGQAGVDLRADAVGL